MKMQEYVLIADDNARMRQVLSLAVQRIGVETKEVENGAAALDFMRKSPPALILLDAMMPVMDGFEVCAEIRSQPEFDNISIVMVTSLNDGESISRAFDAGATDFITKPLNLTILSKRIRFLLKSHRSTNFLRESDIRYKSVIQTSKDGYLRIPAKTTTDSGVKATTQSR
jgi:DNA-binding response OmpR family regulator